MKCLRDKYWYMIAMLTIPAVSLATTKGGFGGIAKNIHQPVSGVIEIVKSIVLVVGIGMLVGALIKYKQHRSNPVEVTIGSVITLLLAGLALIGLTFIPMGRA